MHNFFFPFSVRAIFFKVHLTLRLGFPGDTKHRRAWRRVCLALKLGKHERRIEALKLNVKLDVELFPHKCWGVSVWGGASQIIFLLLHVLECSACIFLSVFLNGHKNDDCQKISIFQTNVIKELDDLINTKWTGDSKYESLN